jgi:hypothetical protein
LYRLYFAPACRLNERTSKEYILETRVPDPGSDWDGGIGDHVFHIACQPFSEFADERPGWSSGLFRWDADAGTRNASLQLWGDGKFTWHRPDVPPRFVIDETGTYVESTAR